MTATKYNMNMLSKDEARRIISALDLEPIDRYVSCVQRDYAKIMADEKKLKRGKRADVKIIDEVIDCNPVVVESIVEESHEVVTIENE
jgi:hypothetical protein